MKSFFSVLKINMKLIFKGLPIIILMYIAMPTVLSLFSSGVFNAIANNEIKKDNILIENKDNSIESQNLIGYLKNDGLKKYFDFNKDEKSEITLVIPKGYGEQVKDKSNGEIIIKEGEDAKYVDFLKSQINNYNNSLFIEGNVEAQKKFEALNNNEIVKFNGENKSTEVIENKGNHTKTTLGAMGVSFLGMLLGMFIASSAQADNTSIAKNSIPRIMASPNSKNKLYWYSFAEDGIQLLIIMIVYVIFFRSISTAFSGNLFILLAMILATTFIIVAVNRLLKTYISVKWNMVVTMALMLVSMMGSFSELEQFGIISKFSPFTLIINMFNNVSSLEGIKIMICLVIMAIIIISISLIKINFKAIRRNMRRGRV